MKKNIILISMDDAGGYSQFRNAFGEPLQVPHLDRIEAQATSFQAAYCQAPVCGPSRNSFMSGLSPHQTGILDNYTKLFDVLRPEQLWQFRLKQRGYYCSTAGKVHHGYRPLPDPVHNALYSHPPRPLVLGPGRMAEQRRFGGITGGAGTTDARHDPAYYDHQSASDAIQFLESHDGDTPFYREIGFHHPHLTWKTPVRFKELYDITRFEPPADWDKGFQLAAYQEQFYPGDVDMRALDFWRKSIRNYFSAFSHVDHQIGRIWDTLQASRHAKNTIVIITSDHGYHLGDKGRIRKFTLWEESCRVPLIIFDPDAAAQTIEEPVALLDIGPTILDYSDCPALQGSPGRSLKSIVQGAPAPDRAVPTFVYGNVGIRKGRYRLNLYQNGETELQDVLADPWFTENLGTDHPAYRGLYEDLLETAAEHGLALDGRPGAFGFRLDNAGETRGALGAVGMLDAQTVDTQPTLETGGTHFSTLSCSGNIRMPQCCNHMHYGADNGQGIESFTCFGKSGSEVFAFPGSMTRFELTLVPGPGPTSVLAGNDRLVVFQDTGPAAVRCSLQASAIVGGAAELSVEATSGPAWIQGGIGDLTVAGDIGRLDVVSGSGRNQINTGAAHYPPTLHLTAGKNEVTLGEGPAHLILGRTGLPHRITGFQEGTIDLSDWAPLGPAVLSVEPELCRLTCLSETAIFYRTDPSLLLKAIKGHQVMSAEKVA